MRETILHFAITLDGMVLEHDLWDGLDMLVHPLVIGQGKPLLTALPTNAALHLVASKTYDNRVVNLRYEKG
ncbi:MAG: hypothetical protein R2932_51300 [Caldilineaceae bacterium]